MFVGQIHYQKIKFCILKISTLQSQFIFFQNDEEEIERTTRRILSSEQIYAIDLKQFIHYLSKITQKYAIELLSIYDSSIYHKSTYNSSCFTPQNPCFDIYWQLNLLPPPNYYPMLNPYFFTNFQFQPQQAPNIPAYFSPINPISNQYFYSNMPYLMLPPNKIFYFFYGL